MVAIPSIPSQAEIDAAQAVAERGKKRAAGRQRGQKAVSGATTPGEATIAASAAVSKSVAAAVAATANNAVEAVFLGRGDGDATEAVKVDSGWKGFSAAFSSIMERDLEKADAPVLADTTIENKILERKAEMKEKRMKSLANKALKDQGHEMPDIINKTFEMQLRKIATQGVVRLFNAVKDFQARSEENLDQREMGKTPVARREKKMEKAQEKKFGELWQKRDPKAKRRRGNDAADGGPNVAADPMAEFDD